MSKTTGVSSASMLQPVETAMFQIGGELPNIPAANSLNGKNYFRWSHVIHTLFEGKGI